MGVELMIKLAAVETTSGLKTGLTAKENGGAFTDILSCLMNVIQMQNAGYGQAEDTGVKAEGNTDIPAGLPEKKLEEDCLVLETEEKLLKDVNLLNEIQNFLVNAKVSSSAMNAQASSDKTEDIPDKMACLNIKFAINLPEEKVKADTENITVKAKSIPVKEKTEDLSVVQQLQKENLDRMVPLKKDTDSISNGNIGDKSILKQGNAAENLVQTSKLYLGKTEFSPDTVSAVTENTGDKTKKVEKLMNLENTTEQSGDRSVLFQSLLKEVSVPKMQTAKGEPTVTVAGKDFAEELPKIVTAKLQQGDRQGDKEFIIRLEPKELGKMTVKLTSQEGVVTVKIFAEHAETKQMLESGMTNLRQSFNEQGIKYGRMDVELGGQYINQQQQQQQSGWFQERNHGKNRWQDRLYYSDAETFEAIHSEILQNSSVNYIA